MLDAYYGEFLVNPIPLELSMNYCSHKCAYCFANLNHPRRKLDAPRLMRFLADYRNRETLAARLLQAGYPVCISNKVDPFAASNFQQTLPILEGLTALGVSVQLQTKGGQGIDRALEIVSPSVWYVSISTDNDDLRQKIEPGAPSIAARIDLIAKLTDMGHGVVVGINPIVPEWLPDPAPLLVAIRAAGAWGCWIEPLHLNKKQIANLTPTEAAALTPALIARAREMGQAEPDRAAFLNARQVAKEIGLHIYSVGQPCKSRFFDLYRQLYPRTFPVMQDFVNHCIDSPPDLLEFSDFNHFMLPDLPAGLYRLSSYFGATDRRIFGRHKLPKKMSYEDILKIYWIDPTTKNGLAGLPSFAYAALAEPDGWTQLTDHNNLPYLLFGNFETYFQDVRN